VAWLGPLLLFWAAYAGGAVTVGFLALVPDAPGNVLMCSAVAALALTTAAGAVLSLRRRPARESWMVGLVLSFAWVPLAYLAVFLLESLRGGN
jgi:hypothetical protein